MKTATFEYLTTKDKQRASDWRAYDPENYHVDTLFNRLDRHLGSVSSQLKKYKDQPLKDYTKELWTSRIKTNSPYSHNAENHLINMMGQELRSLFEPEKAAEALNQFQQHPVFQTGPHCQLIVEPTTFYTSLFSAIGAESAGQRYFFNYTCSSITLDGSCKRGPGWLNIEGTYINIFNYSRKILARTSVCAAPGPVTFAMQTDPNHFSKKGMFLFECLTQLRHSGSYATIPEAFRNGNMALWEKWSQPLTPRPVYMDDFFMAKLLKSHLTDPDSFIFRMLFHADFLNRLEERLTIASRTPTGNMLPNIRSLFLSPRKNRMRAMILSRDYLEEDRNTNENRILFSKQSLIQALENHTLFPGLFLVFLMISFLPGIKVLGGLHQLAYYDLWRKILIDLCTSISDDNGDELKADLQNTYNNGFGFHVLEDVIPVYELLYPLNEGHQIDQLLEKYRDESLWKISRALEPLRVYPRWGALLCN